MRPTLFILFISLPLTLFANESISRRIISFWDRKTDRYVDYCLVHKTLEMPLNHLGLDVEYYEVSDPLPDLSNRPDVRGILLSFNSQTTMENPGLFIYWLGKAMDLGKKVVILGNPGFRFDNKGASTPAEVVNLIYERLGFFTNQESVEFPFDYKIVSQAEKLTGFEKNFPSPLEPFDMFKVEGREAQSYLTVGIPNESETYSDLIILNPQGGFVADFYANNWSEEVVDKNPRSIGWYINPFLFFKLAYDLASLPIPDTSTLAGRRIFYSHCDGDAWDFNTDIEEFEEENLSCADVILKKVIEPNPDIPIAVSVIAAVVDPDWAGTKRARDTTRRYFATPQVEAASHTYSHPFDWRFFEYDSAKKEIYFLYLYRYGTWQSVYLSWFRAKYYQYTQPTEFNKLKLKWGYVTPRAYANEKFNLNKEITGAVAYLNQFAPPNNKVKLLLWSGDSIPWAKPVELCYKNGIKNLGGGFTRFDPDYPSTLYVYPLGRKPGGRIQTYASTSSEIVYTDGWKKDFFAFQHLPQTWQNTGSPRRLKPLSLFYHSYSGQFVESVEALLKNIEFLRTQTYIPIKTSRFTDIVEGFYTVELEEMGSTKWKVHNRKGLQTIRFDQAEGQQVDITASKGVLGFTHDQGSLYVYLDAAVQEPVIQLGKSSASYLLDSSWETWNLKREEESLMFQTQGIGKLSFRWKGLTAANYTLTATTEQGESKSATFPTEDGVLTVKWELPQDTPITLIVKAP